LEALRAKYKYERDRRLRKEGFGQYIDVGRQDLADSYGTDYGNDPYTPAAPRDPVSDEVDVAILGGGFAGLLTGARLRGAGIKDVRIIEMAGDVGGTWYWNRYPGIQCDVDAYCYLPLLEELNYIPKHKYSFGPEIFEHCQRIAKHFGLYDRALFSTLVDSLCWDASINRWHIRTKQDDDVRARFVVMAFGPLNKPKLPGIPGLNKFKGHTFHTARWDYNYTGGDNTGGLTKLADKRVAIIGTGATAIQCVPFLGKYAKQLYVIQRTPSYVDERGNRPTDPEWAKTLKPGWQEERIRNAYAGTNGTFAPGEVDMICDGWSEVNRNMSARLAEMGYPKLPREEFIKLREMEDYKAMERLRQRTATIVKDQETAEMLKAWYRFNCKRPCFNDDYLPTFNRPNVKLIDVSDTQGVERMTEKGFVANGVEYEVDCVIFASGFEFTADIKRSYAIGAINGRNGRSLYDHWAKGFRTLHGLTTHGFPNQFFTGYTQGALGNVTAAYDQQAMQIAYIVKETLARGAETVECTREGEEGWCKTIRETSVNSLKFWQECTPGVYNGEGEEEFRSPLGESYGPGFYAFNDVLKGWRDQGDMAGLVLGK
jgi:cyclohexanone monooxygenase